MLSFFYFSIFDGTWSYTYSKEIQVQHDFKTNEKIEHSEEF